MNDLHNKTIRALDIAFTELLKEQANLPLNKRGTAWDGIILCRSLLHTIKWEKSGEYQNKFTKSDTTL